MQGYFHDFIDRATHTTCTHIRAPHTIMCIQDFLFYIEELHR